MRDEVSAVRRQAALGQDGIKETRAHSLAVFTAEMLCSVMFHVRCCRAR